MIGGPSFHVTPLISAVLTLIREHQLIETQEKLDKARSYRERTLLRGRVEHAASS